MTTQRHHKVPSTVPPANQFTILVVDDMRTNRVLLRKFLKTVGYAVVECSSAVEALDMMMSGELQPNLIISDVEMPVMDGIDMVEQLRFLKTPVASVPIIVASGNPSDEMARRSLTAGADIFLSKPFDLAELRNEIAELVKLSGSRPKRPQQRMNEPAPGINRLKRNQDR